MVYVAGYSVSDRPAQRHMGDASAGLKIPRDGGKATDRGELE